MFTGEQVEKFGKTLLSVIQDLIGTEIRSDEDLYLVIQKLPVQDRKGIWQVIASKLDSTTGEVHDYYFNTWQLQFYENVGNYRAQLKQIFSELYNAQQTPKEIIGNTISVFNDRFPTNSCNQRKLYQIVYRYIQGRQHDNSIRPKLSIKHQNQSIQYDQESSNSCQLSIFDNYAFQQAVAYEMK
ncbi:Conserved_hypothetical protein [Hexamita inflata]|uniref:Uncharacterized protein n=1 Tax=Hexamita inflata TaxID=28002 RepID=A0AA86QZ06_9EUKA|nr:Conserved hypothetical protein [Hexamita inflata]CAI9966654.1 Conserved hypothetical protein [Hexamita inflata]CAI9966655.1 Conserved hypothetical protein [Hexamita inflata]